MNYQRVITCFIACLLYTSSAFCASLPLNGPASIPVPFSNEKPNGADALLDAFIGRPLLLGMTVLGAGLFLISLPTSIAQKEVGGSARAFVEAPAKATVDRCIGCSVNMAKYDFEYENATSNSR